MGSADAADFDRFVSSVAAPTIMSRSPPIDQPVPQSRVKRISSVVEKTVDKLSRSVASSPTIPAPSSPRSVFGLSRKSRTPHTSQDMTGECLILSSVCIMDQRRCSADGCLGNATLSKGWSRRLAFHTTTVTTCAARTLRLPRRPIGQQRYFPTGRV